MNTYFRKWFSGVLISALVFPVTTLSAGSKPNVIVPAFGGGPNDRAREALIQALNETGRVSIVDSLAVDSYLKDQKADGGVSNKDSGSVETLKKGIQAFRSLKMDAAFKLLNQAKVSFRNHLKEEGAFEGLRAAQFYLAMCYLAKKDRNRAKEELFGAIVLDPERKNRKLSDKLYSTEVRKLFNEVRNEVSKKEHGDLLVETKAQGEIVFVDGKSYGMGPIRIMQLPVGEHFVRVESEGKVPYFQSHVITAGENRVLVELKTLKHINPYAYFSTVSKTSDIEHDRVTFLDEMGLALGGDIFVLLVPEEGTVRAQLYDQRSQEVSSVQREKTPELLAKKLVSVIDSDGYVIPQSKQVVISEASKPPPLPDNLIPKTEGTLTGQVEQRPPQPEGLAIAYPWYENPWLWIVAGTVLVGGGIALGFSGLTKSEASRSSILVSVPGK